MNKAKSTLLIVTMMLGMSGYAYAQANMYPEFETINCNQYWDFKVVFGSAGGGTFGAAGQEVPAADGGCPSIVGYYTTQEGNPIHTIIGKARKAGTDDEYNVVYEVSKTPKGKKMCVKLESSSEDVEKAKDLKMSTWEC